MDNLPKRIRRKDNPYMLSKDEENDLYFVSFKDWSNIYRSIRVTKEIYEVFDRSELEDKSEMNEFDRHIEHIPLDVFAMSVKSATKVNFEDEILSKMDRDLIEQEIWKLPFPQNRRIYRYLIEHLTNKEIAELEHCHHSAISESINWGLKKLRKKLKNF
ncbi:MAG: hypothetical protein K6B70_06550 [Clostridia bacterium]|nr:hypothetical protein [Clostridia bacterium]